MKLSKKSAIAAFALAGCYLLSLCGRNGHPAFEVLSRYRYAHRGLHDKSIGVPENSLAAFRRAAEAGFGAELDVHLTKDGRLAVIHDSDTSRVTGKPGSIPDMTAEEIAGYRLYDTEERVPFLEEVLPIFEGKTPLIVELKTDNGNAAELTKAAVDMLDKYSVSYCIESFDPRVLMWLRSFRPEICRGQLSSHLTSGNSNLRPTEAFALTNLMTSFLTEPDFIAYNIECRDRLSVRLSKELWKVREVSWTIRTPEALAEAERDGRMVIFENFIPGEA